MGETGEVDFHMRKKMLLDVLNENEKNEKNL